MPGMTDYEQAQVDALNRLAAAVEQLAKSGGFGGGGGGSSSKDGGGWKKRAKPPLDQCESIVGFLDGLPEKKKGPKKAYLRVSLDQSGGKPWSIYVFDDLAEVERLCADLINDNRRARIFYTKAQDSRFNDFVAIQPAGEAPKPADSPF